MGLHQQGVQLRRVFFETSKHGIARGVSLQYFLGVTFDLHQGSVGYVRRNFFPTPFTKLLQTVQKQEFLVQCPTSASLSVDDGIGWYECGGVALCLGVEQDNVAVAMDCCILWLWL